MTNSCTNRFIATLMGITVLSACSRPVAYVQHGPVESSVTQPVTIAIPPVEVPTEFLTQTEAYGHSDSKVLTNEELTMRMIRVQNALVSRPGVVHMKGTQASRQMNRVERVILPKINRQIRHQLAPANPAKALVKRGLLLGGLVVLIGGLVLLIAGTGTVAFIGLILALMGAVGTVVSLIGIDS